MRIEIGDIAKAKTDVIVSPTNNSLIPKGELDQHIHEIAGPKLLEACKELGQCQTGHAKISQAFDLDAQYVVHAVGPFYNEGSEEEIALLKSCYTEALDLAKEKGAKSISFPLISTGAKGFPIEKAAAAMKAAIDEWLKAEGYNIDIEIVYHDEAVKEKLEKGME